MTSPKIKEKIATKGPNGGLDVVARLSICDAADMSPRQRRIIAAWLRHHADSLIKDGYNYAKLFRGRFHKGLGGKW